MTYGKLISVPFDNHWNISLMYAIIHYYRWLLVLLGYQSVCMGYLYIEHYKYLGIEISNKNQTNLYIEHFMYLAYFIIIVWF